MVIAAGDLQSVVVLQQKQGHPDAMNEEQLSWSDEMQMWAKIQPLNVSEQTEAARKVGQSTHMITVRGLAAAITPDKRFTFKDMMGRVHIFEVVGEMDYDMKSYMVRVLCREVA